MAVLSSDHRLSRSFYETDARTLARKLLGKVLSTCIEGNWAAGRIVETEAYLGVTDKASHTFGGRHTKRNASMWKRGCTTYVYFTYGMHHCFNVAASNKDDPVAVLIRALEPVYGL